METVGIGIIGAGFVADLHARIYRELSGLGTRLVAVTSRTESRAAELAQRYGIDRVLPDFDTVLNLDAIDVVDLCIPNQIHHEFTMRAAQAGKHVICEKPLTGYFGTGEGVVGNTDRMHMLRVALQNADQMIEAARRYGVKLMYAENWLYSPVIEKAKRLIRASGGTILEIRGEESHHGSHAVYSKSWKHTGGGSLIRLGAHPIGAMLHIKRCEGIWRNEAPIRPAQVMASTSNLTEIGSFRRNPGEWIVRDWEDVENWATAILTFEDGSKGLISATDVCLGGMKDTMDIFLSNARIHCDFSRSNMLEAFAPTPDIFADEYLVEKLETKAGWSFPSVDEEWVLGYHRELTDFVEAVKYDRDPLSDAQLGRDVVEVIYSAYLSAAEGRVVHLA